MPERADFGMNAATKTRRFWYEKRHQTLADGV
jgi:hypothetical protein